MAGRSSAWMRVNAIPQKITAFLTRLEAFCREHDMLCVPRASKMDGTLDGQQGITVILGDLRYGPGHAGPRLSASGLTDRYRKLSLRRKMWSSAVMHLMATWMPILSCVVCQRLS